MTSWVAGYCTKAILQIGQKAQIGQTGHAFVVDWSKCFDVNWNKLLDRLNLCIFDVLQQSRLFGDVRMGLN